MQAGPAASAKVAGRVRAETGLDQLMAVQFIRYVTRLTQGDLGRSLVSNKTVARELKAAIIPTALPDGGRQLSGRTP